MYRYNEEDRAKEMQKSPEVNMHKKRVVWSIMNKTN